jgi:hypothetical protein
LNKNVFSGQNYLMISSHHAPDASVVTPVSGNWNVGKREKGKGKKKERRPGRLENQFASGLKE